MIPVTTFAGRKVAAFGLGGSGLASASALLAGGADVIGWDDDATSAEKANAAGIPTADLRHTLAQVRLALNQPNGRLENVESAMRRVLTRVAGPLELGTMYAKLGSAVTVVEMMDQLLPGFDAEIVRLLNQKLRKRGVAVHLGTRAVNVDQSESGVRRMIFSLASSSACTACANLSGSFHRPSPCGHQTSSLGQRGWSVRTT